MPTGPQKEDSTLTVGSSIGYKGIAKQSGDFFVTSQFGSLTNESVYTDAGYVQTIWSSSSLQFVMLTSQWDYPLKLQIGSRLFSVPTGNTVNTSGSYSYITLNNSQVPEGNNWDTYLGSPSENDTLDFNIQNSDGDWLFLDDTAHLSTGQIFVLTSQNTRSLWYYSGQVGTFDIPSRNPQFDIDLRTISTDLTIPKATSSTRQSLNVGALQDDQGNIVIVYASNNADVNDEAISSSSSSAYWKFVTINPVTKNKSNRKCFKYSSSRSDFRFQYRRFLDAHF